MRAVTMDRPTLTEQARQRPGERGIALMLTLGIVALVLILAMGFAFTARTDRYAAAIGADLTRTRLLCESGLERAMAYMYHSSRSVDAPRSFVLSTCSGSVFTGTPADAQMVKRFYNISRADPAKRDTVGLAAALATDLGLNYVPPCLGDLVSSGESWQQVEDPDGNLTGRFCYLVVDETGRLDPYGLVTHFEPFQDDNDNDYHDASEQWHEVNQAFDGTDWWSVGASSPDTGGAYFSPGEPYYDGTSPKHYLDIDGDGAHTDTASSAVYEGSEWRKGVLPLEIDLRYVFRAAYADPTIGERLRSRLWIDAADGTRQGTWFSWRHLATGLGVEDASDRYRATRMLCPYFQGRADKEAFYEYDSTTSPVTVTAKRRLNVKTFGWDTPGAHTQLLSAGLNVDYQETDSSDNECIPWLREICATLDLDGSGAVDSTDHELLRKQVCANLVDFCDSDSEVTTDYDGSLPGNDVSHCGLERGPYINEVAFQVQLQGPLPAGGGDDYEFSVDAFVELVNIYDTAFSDIEVKLFFDYPDLPGIGGESRRTYTQSGLSVSANSYHVIHFPQETMSLTDLDAPGGDIPVEFQIDDVVVTVEVDGELLDYARVTGGCTAVSLDPGGSASASLEARDPRCNTHEAGWVWSGFLDNTSPLQGSYFEDSPPYTTYNGRRNSVGNPSDPGIPTDHDPETVTDPKDGVSTAYIPNAPVQTLWELGAVHRGEPWRTLNLRAYALEDNAADSETYANGDGRLLDQVDWFEWEDAGGYGIRTLGKVDANSPLEDVWKPVLYGVETGRGYADPLGLALAPGSRTPLDETDANTLAPQVAAAALAGAKAGRGALCAVTALQLGSTDRSREELVGKLANILTVGQRNYFTVIVAAQTLKDLGTVSTDESFTVPRFTDGTDREVLLLAEQKILSVVSRDAVTKELRVERVEFLEGD